MHLKLYKMLFLLSIIIIVTLLCTSNASAAPASRLPEIMEQPSGESFTVELQGDEWFNYWILKDSGEIISKGEDGYWYYANYVNGKIIVGTKKVGIGTKPKDTLKVEQLQKSSQFGVQKAQALKEQSIAPQKAITLERSQKTLVLLVEFNDCKLKQSEYGWYRKIFSMETNSVNKYYDEVSNGYLSFEPVEESAGTANDGVIKVGLDYNHPNTGGTIDEKNRNIERNALRAADPYINYAAYDSDKNGYISGNELRIITVVAGFESSFGMKTPSIWSHRWHLYTSGANCDGVQLCDIRYGGYIQTGEYHSDENGEHAATIGVICHELGHELGLPDLYDTDISPTSRGVGVHSLMGSGNWASGTDGLPGSSPAHLDAWSKVELGFVTPIISEGSGTYEMKGTGSKEYNVLKIPTSSAKEYFLVENREFSGYDYGLNKYCKNGGIAVWHIDEGVITAKRASNKVNTDEKHKGIDLKEANEITKGYCDLDKYEPMVYKGYDHYFYSGGTTTFDSVTTPSSILYDLSATSISISTSSSSGQVMFVTVKRPVVEVNPIAGSGKEGRQYSATMTLKGAFSLKSMETVLKYDPEMMSIKNVTSSSITGVINVDGATTPGAIYFRIDNNTPIDFSTESTMLNMDFDLLKYGNTALTIEECILKNNTDGVVACTTTGSSITIKPIVGNIEGKIRLDSRYAYEGINVTVGAIGIHTTTDEEGNIILRDVPVGEQTLIISHSNYLTKKVTVNVLEDQTIDIGTITLAAGDANGDNIIDTNDLNIVKAAYRSKRNGTNYIPSVDFNNDGVIDLVDLGILMTNFGLRGEP